MVSDQLVADQAAYLSILSQAPAQQVKQFADDLLPLLGAVEVLQNRTGLIMLPATDSVQGTAFYLGEVLIAEAHVRLADVEGYGACLGRDLQHALAVAILDAALRAGQQTDQIATFVDEQGRALAAADDQLLRAVEATRVEMETF
jgi:alpha-D-ribose 1-methylphosphonate 5-triphosphate synthase subunit PhnG